jgi:hypothetical protein
MAEKPDKIVSYLRTYSWPDVSTGTYLLNYPLVPTRELLQLLYCEGPQSNLVLLCQTIEIFVAEFSMNVCVAVEITVLCNGGGFFGASGSGSRSCLLWTKILPIYWKYIQIFLSQGMPPALKNIICLLFFVSLNGSFLSSWIRIRIDWTDSGSESLFSNKL